uniref:Uncharacterized protein n=1 Tax=Arundo donax TaxID=35708 RepID=A0A0A9D0W8_ARUDO
MLQTRKIVAEANRICQLLCTLQDQRQQLSLYAKKYCWVAAASHCFKTTGFSPPFASGQAWKSNFIEGEKADPSIINMTIFQRNAPEIIFHGFQFNPRGRLTPAPD